MRNVASFDEWKDKLCKKSNVFLKVKHQVMICIVSETPVFSSTQGSPAVF